MTFGVRACMYDALQPYRHDPTAPAFRAARASMLKSSRYHPRTTALQQAAQAIRDGDFDAAAGFLRAEEANLSLSPRRHMLMAEISAHRGATHRADAQRYLAYLLVRSLATTGTGAPWDPIEVLHASDVHDVLAFRGLDMAKRSIHPRGDRALDRVECSDSTVLWFDLTELRAAA